MLKTGTQWFGTTAVDNLANYQCIVENEKVDKQPTPGIHMKTQKPCFVYTI